MKPLGERIRDLRKQRNMNQRELSRKTGLLPLHIKSIEAEEKLPSPKELRDMLGGLGMPVTDLFLMSCSSDSLPRWALIRVVNWLRDLETEMVDQLHRLPKPPEDQGDGPQERVEYVIDVLRNAEVYAWYEDENAAELKTRLASISRIVREALDQTDEYRLLTDPGDCDEIE